MSLCGIPDEQLTGLTEALARDAFGTVEHFDVFSGERFLRRPEELVHLVHPPASFDWQTAEVHQEANENISSSMGSGDQALVSSEPPASFHMESRSNADIGVSELFVKKQTHTVVLKMRPQYLTAFIKLVKTHGVGEEFGSIDVADVRCTTYRWTKRPAKLVHGSFFTCWQRFLLRIKSFNSTALDRMSTLEIHASIEANSRLSVNHVACIFIASGMAAIGLLTDSSAFVLAAFFVSPLMQMIVAVVWGFTVKDLRLATRGFRNMIIGAVLTLSNGVLVGVIVGLACTEETLKTSSLKRADHFISINTQQISSRGPPVGNVVMSALIAALSGIAIALGHGSGIASALTGVCISTSVLPPLVNAGMMFSLQMVYRHLKIDNGYSLSTVGLFSLYLYLANITCIIIFAWAAFKCKHVGGRTLRPMYRDVGIDRCDLHSNHSLINADLGLLHAFSPNRAQETPGFDMHRLDPQASSRDSSQTDQ